MRLFLITTIPATQYHFLAPQIALAVERGHEVHLVCGPDPWVTPQALELKCKAPVHVVSLRRAISPLADIGALAGLYGLFRRLRPDVVHYSTPKASLLGALAAWLARVPRRVYTNRGLLSADQPGLKGAAWRAVERLICRLSHAVTCSSDSNRRFMVEHRLCPESKLRILGKGSSHGVDARGRFDPGSVWVPGAAFEAAECGLPCIPSKLPDAGKGGALPVPPDDAPVVYAFVGRLARDKGLAELAAAWPRVAAEIAPAWLVVAGPESERLDRVLRMQIEALRALPRVSIAGARHEIERLYRFVDVLVLPSYREGFPNVALEAAAMEVPVITTNALGCVDAVRDGETGLVVPLRDAGALAGAMVRLGRDLALRRRMGRAGREWVVREFEPERIAKEWLALVEGSARTEVGSQRST